MHFGHGIGHNQGPPIINEYGEWDVPVYVLPAGEKGIPRPVYATHRPWGKIQRIRQPSRTPPLKVFAGTTEADYDLQGRYIGETIHIPMYSKEWEVAKIIATERIKKLEKMTEANGCTPAEAGTALRLIANIKATYKL